MSSVKLQTPFSMLQSVELFPKPFENFKTSSEAIKILNLVYKCQKWRTNFTHVRYFYPRTDRRCTGEIAGYGSQEARYGRCEKRGQQGGPVRRRTREGRSGGCIAYLPLSCPSNTPLSRGGTRAEPFGRSADNGRGLRCGSFDPRREQYAHPALLRNASLIKRRSSFSAAAFASARGPHFVTPEQEAKRVTEPEISPGDRTADDVVPRACARYA